eukprot:4998520-Prymnesium_polylepis.1
MLPLPPMLPPPPMLPQPPMLPPPPVQFPPNALQPPVPPHLPQSQTLPLQASPSLVQPPGVNPVSALYKRVQDAGLGVNVLQISYCLAGTQHECVMGRHGTFRVSQGEAAYAGGMGDRASTGFCTL